MVTCIFFIEFGKISLWYTHFSKKKRASRSVYRVRRVVFLRLFWVAHWVGKVTAGLRKNRTFLSFFLKTKHPFRIIAGSENDGGKSIFFCSDVRVDIHRKSCVMIGAHLIHPVSLRTFPACCPCRWSFLPAVANWPDATWVDAEDAIDLFWLHLCWPYLWDIGKWSYVQVSRGLVPWEQGRYQRWLGGWRCSKSRSCACFGCRSQLDLATAFRGPPNIACDWHLPLHTFGRKYFWRAAAEFTTSQELCSGNICCLCCAACMDDRLSIACHLTSSTSKGVVQSQHDSTLSPNPSAMAGWCALEYHCCQSFLLNLDGRFNWRLTDCWVIFSVQLRLVNIPSSIGIEASYTPVN